MTTHVPPIPLPLAKSLRAGLIGGALAAILNLVLYFAGRALQGGPLLIAPPGSAGPMALPLVAVLLFCLMPGLAAGLLYALFSRLSARPERWLLGAALVVYALFFIGPFGAATSAVTVWTLQLMHLVAAAAILWAIFRYARA